MNLSTSQDDWEGGYSKWVAGAVLISHIILDSIAPLRQSSVSVSTHRDSRALPGKLLFSNILTTFAIVVHYHAEKISSHNSRTIWTLNMSTSPFIVRSQSQPSRIKPLLHEARCRQGSVDNRWLRLQLQSPEHLIHVISRVFRDSLTVACICEAALIFCAQIRQQTDL